MFFDNVGGEILDAALARIVIGARIVLCGGISQYNATEAMRGPSNYMSLVVNRARMEGFLVTDYLGRFGEGARDIADWLADGRLIAREDVVEGSVADFPATFLRLFHGENTGKLLLHIRD